MYFSITSIGRWLGVNIDGNQLTKKFGKGAEWVCGFEIIPPLRSDRFLKTMYII